jgi:hypothetical protein
VLETEKAEDFSALLRIIRTSIFWDITPYSRLKIVRHFLGSCLSRQRAACFLAWLILWPWRWRWHFLANIWISMAPVRVRISDPAWITRELRLTATTSAVLGTAGWAIWLAAGQAHGDTCLCWPLGNVDDTTNGFAGCLLRFIANVCDIHLHRSNLNGDSGHRKSCQAPSVSASHPMIDWLPPVSRSVPGRFL